MTPNLLPRGGGVVRALADFFLPRGCLGCGVLLPAGSGPDAVCGACLASLRPPPFPRCPRCDLPVGTGAPRLPDCGECRVWPALLIRARSAVVLDEVALRLCHALKYGGWAGIARIMGARMVSVLSRPLRGAIVVPVPTTPRRRRTRGYNQAELLARFVAREAGLPLVDALVRLRGGSSQVSLQPAERRDNVRRAFSLRSPGEPRLRGCRVILVDDVLTTGATTAAVTEVLGGAGAASVEAVTFARTMPFAERSRPRGIGRR